VNNETKISQLLKNLDEDIRAEVLISGLIENDYIDTDWVVSCDGLFKRSYGKDLHSIDKLELEGRDNVSFHLSRDGFYDSLPEGLFHPMADKPLDSGSELAKESKKERKREFEIRKFFAPFEQEIFNVKLLIENKERQVLTKLIQGHMSDFFTKFWKIDQTFNKKLITRMVAYLPFVQKIIGDYNLAFKLLEHIIEEEVSYDVVRSRKSVDFEFENENTSSFTLGESSLSWDFVCGSTMADLTPLIEIKLGPICNSSLVDYFEGGKTRKFINYFCSFFLPLEVDYALLIETSSKK